MRRVREMIHRGVAERMVTRTMEVSRGGRRRSDVPAQVRRFITVETRQAEKEVQRRQRDQQDGQAAPRGMTSPHTVT